MMSGACRCDDSNEYLAILEEGAMTSSENGRTGPQLKAAPLMTSGTLIGVGGVLVMAGLAVGSSHLTLAIRQWIRDMEVPPSEQAKLRWVQAKTAATAAAAAWQNGGQAYLESVS
jgi:hypothetical protein